MMSGNFGCLGRCVNRVSTPPGKFWIITFLLERPGN